VHTRSTTSTELPLARAGAIPWWTPRGELRHYGIRLDPATAGSRSSGGPRRARARSTRTPAIRAGPRGVFVSDGRRHPVRAHERSAGTTCWPTGTAGGARTDHADPPRRMLLWHANYHPTRAALLPLDRGRSTCAGAAGDDVTRSASCASASTAAAAYITPTSGRGCVRRPRTQRFFDKQGRCTPRLGRLRARVRLPPRGDAVAARATATRDRVSRVQSCRSGAR